MVTFCPMCQANLDTRQADISQEAGKDYRMPILYVTELMGIVLGGANAKSWLAQHLVSPEPALAAKDLI